MSFSIRALTPLFGNGAGAMLQRRPCTILEDEEEEELGKLAAF